MLPKTHFGLKGLTLEHSISIAKIIEVELKTCCMTFEVELGV